VVGPFLWFGRGRRIAIDPRRGGFMVQSMDFGTMFISFIFIMNAEQQDENQNFFGVWEGNNGAENSAEELNTFIDTGRKV